MTTAIRREKKVGNINVHMVGSDELAIRKLAESCGQSASGYLERVIAAHLAEKRREYMMLAEALGCEGSDSSVSSL